MRNTVFEQCLRILSISFSRSPMSIQNRLKERNIQLPEVSAPAAAYVPYVQTGHLVFISGHIAKQNGKPWVGQLGTNMDTATGKQAAETVAIDYSALCKQPAGVTCTNSNALSKS